MLLFNVKFVAIVVVVPAVAVPLAPLQWNVPQLPAPNVPAIPEFGSCCQPSWWAKYLNIELEYEKKENVEKNDTFNELKNLPKEFFQKLQEQVLLMDNTAILTLIKDFKLSNELQNHIENLLNGFKYQELLDLCEV